MMARSKHSKLIIKVVVVAIQNVAQLYLIRLYWVFQGNFQSETTDDSHVKKVGNKLILMCPLKQNFLICFLLLPISILRFRHPTI